MGFGLNVSTNAEIRELFNKAKGKTLSDSDIQKFESIFSESEISDDFQIFLNNAQKHTLELNEADNISAEKHTLENRFQADGNEIFSYETFEQSITKAVDDVLNDDGVKTAAKRIAPSSTGATAGTSASKSTDITGLETTPPKRAGSTAGSFGTSVGGKDRTVTTEKTDDNSYTRITNDEGIVIRDKDGNVSEINFEEISKNFPKSEDKEKLKEVLKELPAELLVDLTKEIEEIVPAKEGEYGVFDSSTNVLTLTLDDNAKYILTHELGHGVETASKDVNGVNINVSSLSDLVNTDKEFSEKYHEELNDFFEAYKEKTGKDHCWAEYETEVSPAEIAATYFVLKSLGESDTDFAEIMAENMPETMKKLDEIFAECRQKSDSERKTETATYYDNGQKKTSSGMSSDGRFSYIDGWNEDGTKAYQEQHFDDGTIVIISDIYDENGNHTTKTEIIKPDEQHGNNIWHVMGGGGGRRR